MLMSYSYRINFLVNDLEESIERTCKGPFTIHVYSQEKGLCMRDSSKNKL